MASMKQLFFRLILPLAIISFMIFTRVWSVLPLDAPESVMRGFPLPYMCTAWHTSMSYQFFLLELLLDFSSYLLILTLIFALFVRFVKPIKVHDKIVFILWTYVGIFFIFLVLFFRSADHLYYFYCPFEYQTVSSSFEFF